MSDRTIEDIYDVVETGQPVLVGHVLKKFLDDFGPVEKINEWVNLQNWVHDFPPVSPAQMKKLQTLYKTRHRQNNLDEECEKPAHDIIVQKSSTTTSHGVHHQTVPSSVSLTPSTISLPISCDIPKDITLKDTNKKLKKKIKEKNDQLKEADNRLKQETLKLRRIITSLKKERSKEFDNPLLTRKLHYDCLLDGVPSCNVPILMKSILKTLKIEQVNVVSRSTVRRFVTELGFLTDYDTVETILKAGNSTLIFDSSTQDGLHVNCIILTTLESSHVVSLEQLAGGTALDYKEHICESIKNLAEIYSSATDMKCNDCLQRLTATINSCLTDRAHVNYAAVDLLETEWQKKLNRVNCNLHPLEAISRCVKKVLADHESLLIKDTYHLSECLANEVILTMNSLRYSNKKGFLKYFTSFLREEGFMSTFIPRFRSNQLHTIFYISAIYFCHYEKFQKFILELRNLRQVNLKINLQQAFLEEILIVEFHVLGLIGKLLSGPWMSTFYTTPDKQTSAAMTVDIIKDMIERLEVQIQDPVSILNSTTDFFGNPLPESAEMKELMKPSKNPDLFTAIIKTCLKGIIAVLRRHQENSFPEAGGTSNDVLASARQHTMLAESVIGEYCERRKRAPSSNVRNLSTIIKAKRNNVREFIETQDESTLEQLLSLARYYTRSESCGVMIQNKKTKAIAKKVAEKHSKTEDMKRKKLQTSLENLVDISFDSICEEFPNMPDDVLVDLKEILQGTIVGRSVKHLWTTEGETCDFKGKVLNFVHDQYEICYLKENDEVAEYCQLTKYEVGADFLCKDLLFIPS